MRIKFTINVDDMTRRAIALRNGHSGTLAKREDLVQQVAGPIDAHLQDLLYDGEAGSGAATFPVMIVGLTPSRHGDNESGIPFRTIAGTPTPSGRSLIAAVNGLGLTLDDFYFTELTKCHAPDNFPTAAEIDNCRPYL